MILNYDSFYPWEIITFSDALAQEPTPVVEPQETIILRGTSAGTSPSMTGTADSPER